MRWGAEEFYANNICSVEHSTSLFNQIALTTVLHVSACT